MGRRRNPEGKAALGGLKGGAPQANDWKVQGVGYHFLCAFSLWLSSVLSNTAFPWKAEVVLSLSRERLREQFLLSSASWELTLTGSMRHPLRPNTKELSGLQEPKWTLIHLGSLLVDSQHSTWLPSSWYSFSTNVWLVQREEETRKGVFKSSFQSVWPGVRKTAREILDAHQKVELGTKRNNGFEI